MKLQKLTIHNIASIENAVIDFEAQPLADSEVFLITGKTGSGKSTILDAICLALFANTPRLVGTLMEGNTKDEEKSITIKDPRQLMRRNTGEAFVVLTFTGSNGVRYEATWSVARARNKATGNLQNKSWRLKNLQTDVTLSKDAEIRAEIKAAIGLDFNQFCRTTMLAQGEFTRFLNSKDEEKAAILEKITGVDIYTKVGKKVFEVTSQKERSWKEAKQQADDILTLTDEEIAAQKEMMATLDAQYKNIKDAVDADKAKLQWIKTDDELTKAFTTAAEDYKQALAAVESDDFKAKELQVKQWNDTLDARNWLTAKEKAVASARQKVVAACNACGITADNPLPTSPKGGAPLPTDSESEDALMPAFLKVQESLKKAEEHLKVQDAEIKAQEETLAALNLGRLREQRDKNKQILQNILTAFDRIETFENEKKRRLAAAKALEEDRASTEKKQEELKLLEPQVHDAKVRMEACKEMLAKQSDTVNKFAKTLRQKLHVGDICPVCRQEIKSELPHEDELAKLVSGLSDAFSEAETSHRMMAEKKNMLQAEIKTATRNYQSAKEAFDKDKGVETAWQKVIAACQACGIAPAPRTSHLAPPHLAPLNALKKTTEAALSELETKITEGDRKDAAIKQQRRSLDKFRSEVWDVRSKTSAALAALQQAEATAKENGRLLEDFLASHPDTNIQRLHSLNLLTAAQISHTAALLDAHRTRALTRKTLLDEADSRRRRHQQERPALQADEDAAALLARIGQQESRLTALAEARGAAGGELRADGERRRRRALLTEEASRRHADYCRWSRMNQLIGDSTGNKFRKIAQSFVLSSLIHSANGYMKMLTDRYELKVAPGTFVITVEDAYQGYVGRAATTISGGESFLVSLALALALSDISSHLAVDTLFIDEGFGTLSGEPLQKAIATLRSLHTLSGRHVAIISHVEDLQERIPVQIQVVQEGHDSSSRVRIVPDGPTT